MWLLPRHSLLVIDGFSSWTSPRIPVVETVLAKLWLCHRLVGSMSACHMAKHTVVMASTSLMSTSLCWWGAAHLFNCLCNGCSLLAISAKTLPSSLLCSLSDCLYCIDQVAENGISSVKATSSKGSHDALAIRVPRWKVASLPKSVSSSGCMALLLFGAPGCCPLQAWICGPEKRAPPRSFKRNFVQKVHGSILMRSSLYGV